LTAEFFFELAVFSYLIGALASGLGAARPRLSVYAAHLCSVVAAAFGIISGALVLLGEAPFRISIPLLTALSDIAPSVHLFDSLGLRVDALSAFFILVISLLVLPVSIYALGYLRE
jgi:hydrogenase-4 component B